MSWNCPYCGNASVLTSWKREGSATIYGCQKCNREFNAPFLENLYKNTPRQGGDGQQGGTHYAGKTDPWELQRTMQTSGNAFVDARRADAIKYAWRNKEGKMLEDLKKARHCLDAAIQELEKPKPEWASSPSFASIVKLHPNT